MTDPKSEPSEEGDDEIKPESEDRKKARKKREGQTFSGRGTEKRG